MRQSEADVLVLGAGMAGLAAARTLSAAGQRVIVLEARERAGGRVFTAHDDALDVGIELGAEFVHGEPPETLALVRGAGLTLVELDGDTWYAADGQLTPADGFLDESGAIFERMSQPDVPDMPLTEFLNRYFPGDRWADARRATIAYAEGFNAARADRISTHGLLQIESGGAAVGERQFKLAGGYRGLVRALRGSIGAQFCFNTVARRIKWRYGEVIVEAQTRLGTPLPSFRAPRVVITLPLGVLKAPPDAPGGVAFAPELPTAFRAALDCVEMGDAVRVTLRLRRPVWEDAPNADLSRLSFLLGDEKTFPVWWTPAPLQAPIITGWVGGTRAERLAGLPEAEITALAIESLARLLGLAPAALEAEVEAWHTHDWKSDPYSRGSYSYPTVGGVSATDVLTAPLEDTLYFAGEATAPDGHIGTVHGALASGYRAARQVLGR